MYQQATKNIDQYTKVLSLEFGLGQVIGFFKMFDGINDYFEVQYSLDNKKRLFCINQLNDIRLLSSKQAITNALEQDTRFMKQLAVKVPSTIEKNVLFIVNRIVKLINQKDLCATEEVLLDLSIESLIQEVKEVFNIDYVPAREIVKESLKIA